MDTKQILEMVLDDMKELDMWFTTKNDPTFEEPSSYYELNEYGELTENSEEKIAKEVQDLIGDGAVDLDDAVELWIGNNASEYRIAYKDMLVTKFEPKPVVDQIEAFEQPKLEEKKVTELYDPIESKLPDLARDVQEFMYNFDTYDYKDNYNDDEEAFEEVMQTLTSEQGRKTIIDKLVEIEYEDNEESIKNSAANLIERIKQFAEELEVYGESKEIKTENVKRRLKEENNKSQNLITDKMQEAGFDPESKYGKIVLKTSDLFNKLSAEGLDVQVSFDNGESQSVVIIDGGRINIVITDAEKELKAFISGNIQVTDENVESITKINNIIKE